MTTLSSEYAGIVAIAAAARADYGLLPSPAPAPELPEGRIHTVAQLAVRDLLRNWGLDAAHFGLPEWNPLGTFIPRGAKVVIKPNLVTHWNRSGCGLDPLVTHPTVLAAVVEYAALSQPSSIIVGDAPVQECRFDELPHAAGLRSAGASLRERGIDFAIRDFRAANHPDPGAFVLCDLGSASTLEPICSDSARFRVTMYDPRRMQSVHSRGRHQYLIARDVLDADVVISVPKLKCHKKACMTGALKNLIGINGDKGYLPHHRTGGSDGGGDCYPGGSLLKRSAEYLLDAANRADPGRLQRRLQRSAQLAVSAARACGADENLEGSWHGNDTIWRTCLDIVTILLYGDAAGRIGQSVARRLLTITDAIVAGEGEGPLAPTPVNAGLVVGSADAAAAEWVQARLMGFDPRKIPLIREAFAKTDRPLTSVRPSAIRVRTAPMTEGPAGQVGPAHRFRPAQGWAGHCELEINSDDSGFRKPPLLETSAQA